MTYHNLFCYAVLKHKRHERNREELTVLLIYIYIVQLHEVQALFTVSHSGSHISQDLLGAIAQYPSLFEALLMFFPSTIELFSEIFKRTKNR